MTLNQILTSLKTYFKRHALINGVNVTLDNDDFNALVGVEYPVVNIQYVDTPVSYPLSYHTFKITIGDLTSMNIQLLDIEIFSDCVQVAEDFFSWLELQEDYDWNKNTTINPFIDANGDRTSGITFTIVLSSYLQENVECQVPYRT